MNIRPNIGSPYRSIHGLGLEVDPTYLLWGIGILAVGFFFLGGREVPKARAALKRRHTASTRKEIARLESRIERLKRVDQEL